MENSIESLFQYFRDLINFDSSPALKIYFERLRSKTIKGMINRNWDIGEMEIEKDFFRDNYGSSLIFFPELTKTIAGSVEEFGITCGSHSLELPYNSIKVVRNHQKGSLKYHPPYRSYKDSHKAGKRFVEITGREGLTRFVCEDIPNILDHYFPA